MFEEIFNRNVFHCTNKYSENNLSIHELKLCPKWKAVFHENPQTNINNWHTVR